MTASDDTPVGRILTRRRAVSLLGTLGAASLFYPRGIIPCVVRPQETEGPYFVDDKLNRSDIRSDPSDGAVTPGTGLALTFNVARLGASACTPLAGAIVDVWHCDARGVYSDVEDPGFNTKGKRFLRGYQVTDANGVARFTTIYPGWYATRAVHVHFKIRSGRSEFTSQLYFDDALTDRVHAQSPYAAKGRRTLRNADDRIFTENGAQLLLSVTPVGAGYAATFDVAVRVG